MNVPAPTYQWYFNDAPYTGATSSTLSFSSARTADAGDYAVVIKNVLGTTTSNKAKLTVSASTTPTPTPTPSSGGGGSISAWFALTLLALAGMRRCRSRRLTPSIGPWFA